MSATQWHYKETQRILATIRPSLILLLLINVQIKICATAFYKNAFFSPVNEPSMGRRLKVRDAALEDSRGTEPCLLHGVMC